MDGSNVFDAHIKGGSGGSMLNALVAEALATPPPVAWSASDDEDHYVQVVIRMMDEDLGFDAACDAVATEVGRPAPALRTAMVAIARREGAAADFGV